MLILWDGLAFFDPVVYKLERIRGRSVGWLDMLKSKKDLFKSFVWIALVLVIIYHEIKTHGQVKSQQFEEKRLFDFKF